MFKDYFEVDDQGNIIEVMQIYEGETVPPNHYEGWGTRAFYTPRYDFELNDWVEGLSVKEIILPQMEAKAAELSNQCEQVIKAGFYHGDDFFAFEDKDQTNFNQQLSLMIVDPAILVTYWKTENNGIKQFTRDQFINICKAAERHKRENIGKFWGVRAYLESHEFKSVEEFEALSFSTGIPA